MHTAASNLRQRLKFRVHEARTYIADLGHRLPTDSVRVVIFAQGRTGSSLLENLLGSTGHFNEHGELLNTRRGEVILPLSYVRGRAKREPDSNFIFHVKLYQLTAERRRPVDPGGFLNQCAAEGWRIIYLHRRNKVKHSISTFVARQRGTFRKYDDRDEFFKVTLDSAALIRQIEIRRNFETEELAALRNLDHLDVVYEDDLENSDLQQATIDRLLDALSLDRRPARTKHRKVVVQPLAELISNYDEILACLKRRGWDRDLEP